MTTRKLRDGRTENVVVDLDWKRNFLITIISYFGFETEFTITDLENSTYLERGLIHNRVLALRKQGWLRKRKLISAKRRDSSVYWVSEKKYHDYIRMYGSLDALSYKNKKEQSEKTKTTTVEVERKFSRTVLPKEEI